jgi:hypothetical protein
VAALVAVEHGLSTRSAPAFERWRGAARPWGETMNALVLDAVGIYSAAPCSTGSTHGGGGRDRRSGRPSGCGKSTIAHIAAGVTEPLRDG